ncbi:MAG: PaaI family thioesterase [Deltaproteobacteria bacterium]|jgi:uncharacterized protein (TIGR00369 family)|nr:PaaI family thioesterase [Deltaproteobacteria bacterium]
MSELARLIAAVPYYRYLRLRPGPDGAVVLPADERHIGLDEPPLLHGGILSAFLEAAGVLHLQATGVVEPATIAVTTDYLRPAPVVDTTAIVTEIRRGRRITHLRVDALQEDERLVATATGSWLTRQRPLR